eukprot:7594880-Lingulodinium_polyedra.AAC.1
MQQPTYGPLAGRDMQGAESNSKPQHSGRAAMQQLLAQRPGNAPMQTLVAPVARSRSLASAGRCS